eukprot:3412314-Pleurochrysis_carterae.AAC.2
METRVLRCDCVAFAGRGTSLSDRQPREDIKMPLSSESILDNTKLVLYNDLNEARTPEMTTLVPVKYAHALARGSYTALRI